MLLRLFGRIILVNSDAIKSLSYRVDASSFAC